MTNTPYTVPLDPKFERGALVFVRDLKSRLHAPISELVPELTGFDLVTIADDCGGYCCSVRKQIAINPQRCRNMVTTLLHEIGHWVHYDSGVEEPRCRTLSYEISVEQQVEAFACRAYRELFGRWVEPSRWAYYSQRDHDFLAEWYDGWIEDDRDDPAYLYQ